MKFEKVQSLGKNMEIITKKILKYHSEDELRQGIVCEYGTAKNKRKLTIKLVKKDSLLKITKEFPEIKEEEKIFFLEKKEMLKLKAAA